MSCLPFLDVAQDLEIAGLLWQPEIGDEVSSRLNRESVSILVDPQGMSPGELRMTYLWLPTLEQMVSQFEARQAILFHAGLEISESAMYYKAIVKFRGDPIESKAVSLRSAVGLALRNLLLTNQIN